MPIPSPHETSSKNGQVKLEPLTGEQQGSPAASPEKGASSESLGKKMSKKLSPQEFELLPTSPVAAGDQSEGGSSTPSAKRCTKILLCGAGGSNGSNGESKRKEVDENSAPAPGQEAEPGVGFQTSKGRKSSRKGSKKKEKLPKNGDGNKTVSSSSDIQAEGDSAPNNQTNNSGSGTGSNKEPGAHDKSNSNKSCCFCWCCCCSCSW